VSHDAPTQMAEGAPAARLMADEPAAGRAPVPRAPSAREPALRDAAVVAHDALDPVGAGRDTRP